MLHATPTGPSTEATPQAFEEKLSSFLFGPKGIDEEEIKSYASEPLFPAFLDLAKLLYARKFAELKNKTPQTKKNTNNFKIDLENIASNNLTNFVDQAIKILPSITTIDQLIKFRNTTNQATDTPKPNDQLAKPMNLTNLTKQLDLVISSEASASNPATTNMLPDDAIKLHEIISATVNLIYPNDDRVTKQFLTYSKELASTIQTEKEWKLYAASLDQFKRLTQLLAQGNADEKTANPINEDALNQTLKQIDKHIKHQASGHRRLWQQVLGSLIMLAGAIGVAITAIACPPAIGIGIASVVIGAAFFYRGREKGMAAQLHEVSEHTKAVLPQSKTPS